MDNERLLILQGFRRLDGSAGKTGNRGPGIVKIIFFGKKEIECVKEKKVISPETRQIPCVFVVGREGFEPSVN